MFPASVHSQIAYKARIEQSSKDIGLALRANRYSAHTTGLSAGKLQRNLVILTGSNGADFGKFRKTIPVFSPLIGTSRIGATEMPELDHDIDLRSDLPLYFVYRPGQIVERIKDIKTLRRDDFMAFAIGCSFTFEHALMRSGIEMRHVSDGVTVTMFRTNIQTKPVGRFGVAAVISMRPILKDRIEKVKRICAAFPHAHGAPKEIGIKNIS